MQPVTLEYTIDGVDESKGIICIGDVDNVQLNGECFLDWCKKKADEGKLPRMLAAVRLHPSVRPGCRQVNTTQVNRVDITIGPIRIQLILRFLQRLYHRRKKRLGAYKRH